MRSTGGIIQCVDCGYTLYRTGGAKREMTNHRRKHKKGREAVSSPPGPVPLPKSLRLGQA